jgi:hypothetical protein
MFPSHPAQMSVGTTTRPHEVVENRPEKAERPFRQRD